MAAGNETEVEHLFARQMPAFGMLDEVEFADQVGNGHIGRGQLFMIAAIAVDPFDRTVIPQRRHAITGIL